MMNKEFKATRGAAAFSQRKLLLTEGITGWQAALQYAYETGDMNTLTP